jgi:hypothetical protein
MISFNQVIGICSNFIACIFLHPISRSGPFSIAIRFCKTNRTRFPPNLFLLRAYGSAST